MISENSVWVFHGENGRFASGVFTSVEIAEQWINDFKLSGILTEYPLNKGIYNWAIDNGIFAVKKDQQKSPEFIQSFTSASQEHFHYENGVRG